MSAGGNTTKHFEVPARDEDIARIAHVRNSRSEFISRTVSMPDDRVTILKQARADNELSGLLVVKLLQELPSVGKVSARRLLAVLGLDEFTQVGKLTDDDIGSLAAECSK